MEKTERESWPIGELLVGETVAAVAIGLGLLAVFLLIGVLTWAVRFWLTLVH